MKEVVQKTSLSHKVGDVFERIGEIVSSCGAKKLGSRIYNFGNKLEHKDDAVKGQGIQ